MKLCKIKAEYIPQKPLIQGIYEKIEIGGRTCYKSEGNTKYDEYGNSTTAESFANNLVNVKKHQSVAEHATIYLKIPWDRGIEVYEYLFKNPYSHVNEDNVWGISYITTNYRVILDSPYGWEEYEPFLSEFCEGYHEPRYTFRVFTDRGVTAEMNRHRVHSPSERSTRYCDYSDDDKFGGMHVILPQEFKNDEEAIENANLFEMMRQVVEDRYHAWEDLDYWLLSNLTAEFCYTKLIKNCDWKPQQARRVLPFDIESEIVVTAFEKHWIKFMGERLYGVTGAPHPDMVLTAKAILEEFKKHRPEFVKKIEDKNGPAIDK